MPRSIPGSTPHKASHKKTPKLRLHKATGQGFVVLNGGKPIYLGRYDRDATHEAYHRLIAEWRANGCRPPVASSDITVVELVDHFWAYAKTYYVDRDGKNTTTLAGYRAALKPLVKLYGSTPVADFDTHSLKAVRQTMLDRGWARIYINKQVQLIRSVFSWGVDEGLCPSPIAGALTCVKPLRKGRSTAPERERIKPAPDHLIDAIWPHANRQVWAMVQIMRLCGARPNEVVRLRVLDLDMSGKVWIARLDTHKTDQYGPDYADSSKMILLGPKAQELIRPFLVDRPVDAYLFSAKEADAERRAELHKQRKTPLSCGNRPGTNKSKNPKRSPGEHYTVKGLCDAVHDACDLAFPVPEEMGLDRQRVPGKRPGTTRWETKQEHRQRLGEKKWAERDAWIKSNRFDPRQLRHNASSELRKTYGIEVAQTVIGHAMGSNVTAMVYAEAAMGRAMEAMAEVG